MIIRKTKALISFLLLITLALSAVSCDYLREFYGREEITTPGEEITTPREDVTTPFESESDSVSDENTIITLPTVDIEMKFKNPYTGLPCQYDLIESRALAFVVDNTYFSSPQDGLGNADILYEFRNNDGGTTFLAIYKNPEDAARVGPLGKANKLTLSIAKTFNAVLFAKEATDELKNTPDPDLYTYEGSGLDFGFFEASDRKNEFGYKYSVMAEGVRLMTVLKEKYVSFQSNKAFADVFKFYEGENEYALAGRSVKSIQLRVSSQQHIQFAYSESAKAFYRYQFGNILHTDAINDNSLNYKNVFILSASVDSNPAADEASVTLTQRGSGYYACNGTYSQINWVRDSSGVFKFYKTDGTRLEVPAGRSYIGFFAPSDVSGVTFK